MDENIYNLIESPDPKDRKRAIKLLAQAGNQEAIKVLAQLYKQETDPEIKELAVKAGQYIKKQQVAGNWEGGGRQLTPDPEPDPVEVVIPDVQVTPAREKESKSLMDQALDYLMNDNRVKAVATARKAFMMNPNLRHDSYYMGIANEVTGRDTPESITMLLTPEPKGGKEKAKRKNDAGSDDVTWGEALTDLAIYGLVNAAIAIVGMLLFIQLVAPPLRDAIATLPPPPSEFGSFEEMQAQNQQQMLMALSGFLVNIGIVFSIIYGVIYGVLAIVGLLIQLFFIHIAAKIVLGGDGTFPGLIRKVTNFTTVVTAIYFIVGFVLAYLIFNSFISASLSFNSEVATINAMSDLTLMSGVMSLFYIISGIVLLVMYSIRIGQAYDFGAGKGCLSIIISIAMIMALSCALQLAFQSMLQQALMGAMMTSSTGF